jgi:CHAT domain-containing protein
MTDEFRVATDDAADASIARTVTADVGVEPAAAPLTEAEAARVKAIVDAAQLVERGNPGIAARMLETVLEESSEVDVLTVQALITLARARRNEGDLSTARQHAEQALDLALKLHIDISVASALEGLGMIALEEKRPWEAVEYLQASAHVEKQRGDPNGAAAALSNAGNALLRNGLEGAEGLLREALQLLPQAGGRFASAADNMASELGRQARFAEAADWSDRAIAAFAAEGDEYNEFIALINMAHLTRGTDHEDRGVRAFERAHDLIIDYRQRLLDHAHYAEYPSKLAATEEHVRRKISEASPEESARLWEAGKSAYESMNDALRLLDAGEIGRAVELLSTSRQLFVETENLPMVLVIDSNLAAAQLELGNRPAAQALLNRVRAVAREFGDAYRESFALSHIARSRWGGIHEKLDCLAQIQALDPVILLQHPGIDGLGTDDGTVEAQFGDCCLEFAAYDKASRYFSEAVAKGESLPPDRRYRLTYRLWNLWLALNGAGRNDEALAALADLESRAQELGADPRARNVIGRANAFRKFESGDRSEETLKGLITSIAAYESIRDQAAGVADLSGLAAQVGPPFAEAAEVAIECGRLGLALALLERGKARGLLEAKGVSLVDITEVGDVDPAVPTLGDAVGLGLLRTATGLRLMRLEGRTGAIDVRTVLADTEMSGLETRLHTLSRQADAELSTREIVPALDAVLNDEAFQRLSKAIDDAVPAGRSAYLSAHARLHQAPLHLLVDALQTPRLARCSLLPAFALAGSLPPPRSDAVVVMGDATGDLPFARLEARLVARKGDTLAIGDDCHIGWLRDSLSGGVGLLHVACHGRYDGQRPERSGLLLADPDRPGEAHGSRLMAIDEIAGLPLNGAVVVMSACSSALESIRAGDEAAGAVSALLRAGAASIVAARWPVADSSAMFFMAEFHARLREPSRSNDLREHLAAAAEHVRTMTTDDLIARALQYGSSIVDLGGTEADAVVVVASLLVDAFRASNDTDLIDSVRGAMELTPDPSRQLTALRLLAPAPGSRSAARPYAHPSHWGAFALIGAPTFPEIENRKVKVHG